MDTTENEIEIDQITEPFSPIITPIPPQVMNPSLPPHQNAGMPSDISPTGSAEGGVKQSKSP
jgi:hypothetical protein